MDLIINHVWCGPKGLGWLECFVIYAWRMYGCTVNIFAHRGHKSEHTHESLGLPDGVVNIKSLRELVEEDEKRAETAEHLKAAENMRKVLGAWYAHPIILPVDEETRFHIYNMVDLTKSYLAATRQGITLDLKIGPSKHIHKFVGTGVFHKFFIGFERAGMTENQLMGNMSSTHDIRTQYAQWFVKKMIPSDGAVTDLSRQPRVKWFDELTNKHAQACTFMKKAYKNVGGGAELTLAQLIGGPSPVESIEGTSFGAFRFFKRADDQTNKSTAGSTTEGDRLRMRSATILDMAENAWLVGEPSPVDVTAPHMPPVEKMLELLDKTKPA